MRKERAIQIFLLSLLGVMFTGSACQVAYPRPDSTFQGVVFTAQVPTRTPFQPLHPTLVQVVPTPVVSDESFALPLWVSPSIPRRMRQTLNLPLAYSLVMEEETAALQLRVGSENLVARWIYALVTPFPSIVENVTMKDLLRSWQGEAQGPFAGKPLLMDANTLAAFSVLWGPPVDGAVDVLPQEDLLAAAWQRRPVWALVPFDDLEPRWKVLGVDGASPYRQEFDPVSYPLSLPVSLLGDTNLVNALLALHGPKSKEPLVLPTNRDPAQMTSVVLTGVTALVRATAYTMEQRGVKYPGHDVRAWLRAADFTHISNEVPFAQNCPFPDPVQADLRFCSNPRYIGLLEDMGVDIVELTGDHFQDWGSKAMRLTLNMYHQRGWLTYGGGVDLAAARRPLTIEHNGNRISFIGCNAKGGSFAQAATQHPGAAACSGDWWVTEIERLRAEGYLPIVTFQHFEYYTYRAEARQKKDFRKAARAGAVIVSGSQAHQPQAFEFLDDSFIHYGLGNLFFDQYDVSQATRQAFIDRHIFYAGRYLGVELLPIQFIDYARPRPMTPQERKKLYQVVFAASGW